MLTYHAGSVSDAESDIFRLLYCMNLSYCHIYNRISWHTADCILKYAVLRILSGDTPSGRLYSIFRISYYSMLLLLYDIILPVYRRFGISGMSYYYHTFTGLFWHIFIIYPGIRHSRPHPAPGYSYGQHLPHRRWIPPQLSTSCPRIQDIRIMWMISGLPWPGICNPPSCFYGFHPGLSESYLNCLNAVRSQGRIPISANLMKTIQKVNILEDL